MHNQFNSYGIQRLKTSHSALIARYKNILLPSDRSKNPIGSDSIARTNSNESKVVYKGPTLPSSEECDPRTLLHRIYFSSFRPFRDPFQDFLSSWRTQLPHYSIIQWNETNIDLNANEWMRRSLKAEDPVFLSEFARWNALKQYGGTYLDADCEVLNGRLFDSLVNELFSSDEYDAFIGVEEYNNGHPTAQTISAKPGADVVKFMHDLYNGPLSSSLWHWRSERGLIGPQLLSLYFREHGLESSKGFFWQLNSPIVVGRVKIYPQEYFSPKFETCGTDLRLTENSCIYHLFANLNIKEVSARAEETRIQVLRLHDYCSASGLNIPEGITSTWQPATHPPHHQWPGIVKGTTFASQNLLPKTLHRIYFGFDGKPDPYHRYLATWKEQMPEYSIKHWNSSNLPMRQCRYSEHLFEEKDHAFLSDYFRWWVLKENGGAYLDADVEIVNGSLLDQLLQELNEDPQIHAIIGIDSRPDGWYTAHSMACKRGSPLAKFMCDVYEGMGMLSRWRKKIFYLMAPQLTSLYFASNGHNIDGMGSSPSLDGPTIIAGVKIYPQEWFSPMRPQVIDGKGGFVIDRKTTSTCLCHHFSCSWHDSSSLYANKTLQTSEFRLLSEYQQTT